MRGRIRPAVTSPPFRCARAAGLSAEVDDVEEVEGCREAVSPRAGETGQSARGRALSAGVPFSRGGGKLNKLPFDLAQDRHPRENSNNYPLDKAELLVRMSVVDQDEFAQASGEDFCRILGFSLRSFAGSLRTLDTDLDVIRGQLRLAFSLVDLQATEIYGRIKQWEASNAPYVILAV